MHPHKKKKIINVKKCERIYNEEKPHKIYVWRVAQYGSETWTINAKEKDTLEALEMWRRRKTQRTS
ncbi:Hypothetical protein CINCED_3A020690 [Cinara cedri]|uniref:Uncharacterized protein n=1 Tax=Cinara cedri TaxID=506608 RepID=A0A5E4MZ38_9HEMI|nr:Hypothetical protein CINCED_3A020690 [Cinara cedri]